MIKNNLQKLYKRLLLLPHKENWFHNKVKFQLINTIAWYLYPEFRKYNILDLIKGNKFIISTFVLFIFWTTSFFSFGRWLSFMDKKETISTLEYRLSRTNDIMYNTNLLMHRKDSTISQLREQMGSRDYLQFVIKRDCHIENYANLTKLSDDVFFTMIDEIERYQIPYTIWFRMIDKETGFRFVPNNQGSGAYGYCQVMPTTFSEVAKKLGLKKHDEFNNIKAGAYVLKQNYNLYRNKGIGEYESWHKALTNYSGGDSDLATYEMQYFKLDLVK